MTTKYNYVECQESDVPRSVRFDVPGSCQGQIVETSYGTFSKAQAQEGDPYMAVTDRSIAWGQPGRTRYFRLEK